MPQKEQPAEGGPCNQVQLWGRNSETQSRRHSLLNVLGRREEDVKHHQVTRALTNEMI